MKFIYAAKNKNGKFFIKYSDDNGAEIYGSTSEKVVAYANKILKEGDEFEAEIIKQGTFVKILKINAKTTTNNNANVTMEKGVIPEGETVTVTNATAKFACADCGKELKNGTYTKCFNCNKSNPEPKPKTYGKSPEEQDSIRKQAVLKASADAVATAFQGQFSNADALSTMIIEVYDKLYAKII